MSYYKTDELEFHYCKAEKLGVLYYKEDEPKYGIVRPKNLTKI